MAKRFESAIFEVVKFNCDAYPFATTKQGKRKGINAGLVSLRSIDSDDNRNFGRRV